jgi:hypothetical protein
VAWLRRVASPASPARRAARAAPATGIAVCMAPPAGAVTRVARRGGSSSSAKAFSHAIAARRLAVQGEG